MSRPRTPSMSFRRVVIGRIAGIELTVHGSWLIWLGVLAGFAWTWLIPEVAPRASGVVQALLSVLLALPLSACIVLHELSHAAIARGYRLRVRRITLFVFGGVAQIENEAPGPGAEFRIALAGPLASLLLAGLFAVPSRLAHPHASGLPGAWGTLAAFNLSLAVFNLLPAFPMDGGRILRSALWGGWTNRARATRWAAGIGRTIALGLVGTGFVSFTLASLGHRDSSPGDLWIIVLGAFLYNAAGAAGKAEGSDAPSDGSAGKEPPAAGADHEPSGPRPPA